MAIQTINIGNVVNDGLGDDLRTAFQKVNANFAELNSQLTVTVGSASTVGTSLFKEKVGAELQFKTLLSGTKISIDDSVNTVTINNTAPDAFTQIVTQGGNVLASAYPGVTFQGNADLDITAVGSVVTVATTLPVNKILTTYDFGPITGAYENAIQYILANANMDFGTILYPSRVNLDCGTLG